MALYKYKAVTREGYEETGEITADNKDQAIAALRGEYELVSEIKEVREKEDFRDTLKIRKIKDKNLSLVCEQFGIILKAGLPIVRTIEMVAEQTEDKYLKGLLKTVAQDVAGGSGLADSFAERGPKLPITFIETVRAGEESGSLDEIFTRLSRYFGKKGKTREKVVSALTYPAMVVAVAVVVVAIINIVAVPLFTQAFDNIGAELPLPTRMVIAVSNFFVHWGWLLLVLILGVIIGLKLYERDPINKAKVDAFRLRIPITGKVRKMDACNQFANTLATMLAAGLPARRAIEITGRGMTNRFIGNQVEEVAYDLEQGFRIADSIRKRNIFPDLLTEMVGVGEETGELESTLEVVGDYYDNEVDVTTTRATKLLEPTIIIILAVIVLFILLAVYAPMFSMYDNVNTFAG